MACRGGHEKPSGIVWTATAQSGTSRSHTSNIVPRRLAERVWWTKFQSPLPNICSRLSGFQSSLLLIYFRDGPNRCSLHQSMAQNLSDMWRSTFRDRPALRSFAPSQKTRCHNRSCVWTDALSGMILAVAQNLSGIVQWRIQGRGARGPPPPPLYFYLVSFWWWRKIYPVKCDSELSRNNWSAFDLALVVHTSLIVTVL